MRSGGADDGDRFLVGDEKSVSADLQTSSLLRSGRHRHHAHCFADDSALLASAERFVLATLAAQDAAIVAMTSRTWMRSVAVCGGARPSSTAPSSKARW